VINDNDRLSSEIRRAVEARLGPVSRSSVKNYLANGATDRKTKVLERARRGL